MGYVFPSHDQLPLCAEHDEFPWMRASFDGITLDHEVIVEIKCPGMKDHQCALDGKVPEKYIPQLQHQLMVSGCKKLHYFSFDGEEGIILPVERDEEYQSHLLEEEILFWDNIQKDIAPDINEDDYVLMDSDEFRDAAYLWLEAQTKLEIAQNQEKRAREHLLSYTDDGNCRGFGVKCSRVFRKGPIDYSLIPELQGINLETYRKNHIGFWKISKD